MTPEKARELLGGLASGILTPEERKLLFEAALHDQALFNELAGEMELAAFLESPDTRAQLANRIEVEPERPRWRLRPAWLALSGVLAASAVVFVAVWPKPEKSAPIAPPSSGKPVVVAQLPAKTEQQEPAVTPPEPRKKQASKGMSATPARARDRVSAPTENKPLPAERAQKTPAQPTPEQPMPAAPPVAPSPAPQTFARAAVPPADSGRGVSGGAPPGAANAIPPMAPQSSIAPMPVSGQLTGTVHDTTGAAVPGAAIDIINTATGVSTNVKSDDTGHFNASSLPPGRYTVVAQARGFKREERSAVILAANQPVQVDIPLEPGAISETVEVTAAAAAVQSNPLLNADSQVAVLEFANRTQQSESGQQAADLLTNQLLDSGKVRVIDRNRVQQLQAEAQAPRALANQPSPKAAAALGRRLGADAVIVGSVFDARRDSNVAITAEVIDTRQGRRVAQANATAGSLQVAANEVGNQLQSKLLQPLVGTVTTIERDSIGVTFATPSHPRIGARFDVFRGTRKIGELTLTAAYGDTAAGKFSGSVTPRRGDRVVSVR